MGAGKKELATFTQGWSSNRNLGKSQLGGVIFGCKNTTINECLSKQLFGLPNQHFVYVEKIDPGLPLFLLNYTNRTLYGVFEAASHGQKNIDPYAWTNDGSQRTPLPAQVQVRVRSQHLPLNEDQFKPIIMDNYYAHNHFWFELDHAQTNRLLSLFSSQPVSMKKWSPCFPSVSTSEKKVEIDSFNDDVIVDEKELVYMKLKEIAREDETSVVNGRTLEPSNNVVPPSDGREEDNTAQLIEKVEDLMAYKTEQTHKIDYLEKKMVSLEQNLAKAENEIMNLKNHCMMLESMICAPEEFDGTNGRNSHSEFHLDTCVERDDDIHVHYDDSILLVGGYDGRSWLTSLDCYSPSQTRTKSLNPMNSARCYAPVAVLNGQVYVIGGGTGGVWYDTVESYDPVVNQWTDRPSLNAKKGSLAGATVKDKIYAVGGGSGDDYFSAVEMLDLDVGAWIPSRSMLQKRFSLAAAELNGALYAVGGYDGKNYLKSAERFDPREHSWTRLESMNTMRGCPSLVVLNEKLYVLGGFDGDSMVSSMEMFDPRCGSWMVGEPMKNPRGFSAATVVKDSIYIFGGLQTGELINHTVECYKEGQGWEVTDTKTVGQRCFFSAVAL